LDDVVESGPRENIKQIFTASTRARDLVKQILTFSRKDGQQQKPLRLTPLVKETYQMLRASVPSTVEMRLSVRTTADTVVADPSQIQQVLINLVSNAAHAMQESGGRLSITLSTRSACSVSDPDVQPGRFVQISVKDTGGGMTPDVQRRIFEPFFTTKEQGRGTGMGLAVVYGIVKRHGGFITVESRTGQGSTFVVSLPLSQEGRARKEERSSLPPLGSERILFVDDEPPIARTTEDMLRRLGYRVVAVIDSTKAWEIFLEDPFQFDLVITDQAMPSFSGTALAKKMLALRPDIPIILCTGYSETVSPEKAKELGIRVFLMKPFDKRRLAAAVRQALDAREGRP
ncbi:MAG: ATP-binding protein, partial [Syntrophorhabdales bacterium]